MGDQESYDALNRLQVKVETEDEVLLVRLQGELDIYTFEKLSRPVELLLRHGIHSVLLDMLELKYMDSKGMGTIFQLAEHLQQAGGAMTVVLARQGPLAMIWQRVRMEHLCPTFYDCEEALTYLRNVNQLPPPEA